MVWLPSRKGSGEGDGEEKEEREEAVHEMVSISQEGTWFAR